MKTHTARWLQRSRWSVLPSIAAATFAAAFTLAESRASAAEPAACLASDPEQWPAPSKPYFMIGFDTSGSMADPIPGNILDSCGYGTNRLAHGRCAIKNTIQAFGGQVNFGLASYARVMTGCPAGACGTFAGCTYSSFAGNAAGISCTPGCGPEPSADPTDSATRAGANILVPMQRDNYFSLPLDASNVPELLSWVDNDCTGSKELFPDGCTPMNGILRDLLKYFSLSWTRPGGPTFNSPLGTLAEGERACRSVNIIFVTDGKETCDQTDDAIDAAADLFTGFTKGGISWKIKTFVIDFGDAGTEADNIAAAGGTLAAKDATNEATLSAALANIISSAISPETCDNADNNCNGCTDEGFKHYCDTGQACCAWATPAQRTTCLNNYKASITDLDPDGNLALLPCTTPAQKTDPTTWLCFNPKEACDTVDNNCEDGVDEGTTKCGDPAHCPVAETCNALDDDCDGQVDEGLNCPPTGCYAETCDGCDNDCNGIADDGIPPLPCGLANPPNCTGQITCKPPVAVPVGGCVPGGGYNTCNNSPQAEICDMLDNNCNGVPDENIPPEPCDPPGGPYVYGPPSQCKQGTKPCNGVCQGAVGPSAEICDGIDNDCDGAVDENVMGVGQACGPNQPPCQPGMTACVNGALVCQGGTGPQPEVCDGADNDCDGAVDDAPLADGPAQGMNGCWNLAGNCCSFQNLAWCPPPGASCNDIGSLKAPCSQGSLVCLGAQGWTCQGPLGPSGEVCDGADNDCNGLVDDGNLPMEGNPCGSDVGECNQGQLQCTNGSLDCVGDTEPTDELCNGLDDNCDGFNDNNIPAQGACVPAFDTGAYPSTPTDPNQLKPPCQTGTLECENAMFVCKGGVGPTPELCDLVDNDCDGKVDEFGPQPSGINGTTDPQPPPENVKVGEACGLEEGACKPGAWGCLNGDFACLGGQGPAEFEQCDCVDNDCDGQKDEENPPDKQPICSPGKTCVKSGDVCQCAEKCEGELSVCSTAGQECKMVTNADGDPLGFFCVAASPCGTDNCASATVKDVLGNVVCAPAGTQLANCKEPPVCACKNQAGCQDPCYNVVCQPGLVCVTHGPNAGTCGLDNCYNVPCSGCDAVCIDGECAPSPCDPNPCAAGEVCKVDASGKSQTCVKSCLDVACASGEECDDGECKPTCPAPCPDGQFCDESQPTPQCAPSMCAGPTCPDGSCCDPKTGACGTCPCELTVCPSGQQCVDGDCFEGLGGAGGAGGAGGGTGVGGGSAGGGGPGGAGGGTTSSTSATGTGGGGTWGLPTGGGGCSCRTGAGGPDDGAGEWAVAALFACALGLKRRRSKRDGAAEVAR